MRHQPANALFCRCGAPWADVECSTSCASCHRPQPERYRRSCWECGHSWRWGWQLSLHDARLYWGLGHCAWPGDFRVRWWQRVRLRRPSKVWVCPCCLHDL